MTSIGTNITANLAKTLFSGGPTDIIPAPDIYGINTNQVINTSVGRFSDFNADGLLSSFQRTATGFLSNITNSLVALSANPLASFSNKSIQARLTSVVGQGLGSLGRDLSYSLAQSVGLNSSQFYNIQTLVGGVIQTTTSSDYENVSNTVRLANQLAGQSDLITISDTGAMSAALTAVTSNLISLGLTSAITSLMTNAGTRDAGAVRAALSKNVKAAIMASDLTTVQTCIDNLGVGGVLAQLPDAALQLFRYYKLPKGAKASDYSTLYTQFMNVVTQLAPNWAVSMRGSVSTTNLQYFAAASADCQKLLRTNPDYLVPTLIAPKYNTSLTLVQQLQQQYPNLLTL